MTSDIWLPVALVPLGFIGGFFSGLLGLGGAIVMIPLLLFVPPLLGFPQLDMKLVAGISMVQVFFASGTGMLAHRRARKVSRDMVLFMGGTSFLGALAGAFGSKYLPSDVLSIIFVALAFAASGLLFLPKKDFGEEIPACDVCFNRSLASSIGLFVGTLGGIVGVGGAFVEIPLQIYVLKVPTRVAVGSTLGIVLLGASGGLIGKLATGQVFLPLAAALVVGAMPGAWLGAAASVKVKVKSLRLILAVVTGAVALRLLWDVLF